MDTQAITVDAVFENGLLRPLGPLPLAPSQRVTLTIRLSEARPDWPDDVAAIYQELAAEDRRLAEAMFGTVRETWPAGKEQP